MDGRKRSAAPVRVFRDHDAAAVAEAAYWEGLSAKERLDAVGECVRDYLRLNHEPEQGFQRVYRVLARGKR